MPSIARLKEIATRYGIKQAADKWHDALNHDKGDAVSYASCVCAAAFDANRDNTKRAEAICDAVWADEELMRERYFRDRRDMALEIFDDYKAGPFVVVGIQNRYAVAQYDVLVDLQCCRCGVRRTARASRLAKTFAAKCPTCGAEI